MSSKFFSVILPSHNGANHIRRMLTSIRSQTFRDYELIVVCDACTDNTEEIAQDFHADKILTVDYQRDGLARNAGLDVAEGKWILFADDDDWFLHEYCFEQLAKRLRKLEKDTPCDVLDFSFVWHSQGYKIPDPAECFVMVWCRAWRREFIGSNRFNDKPYGSDKDFFHDMIQENTKAVVSMWNIPIYYYNYLREGSMTSEEKKHTFLNLIVTHHDEPWEIGKPFFDMLEHQRCVDMNKVAVTLVQDGEEGDLPWMDLLSNYSYPVHILSSKEHVGVANARNAGLLDSKSDWVMFCDFDDMLADVDSLSCMIDHFPTDDVDVIWCKVMRESKWFTNVIYMNCVDEANFSNTDGKMYRRQFLIDNNITFSQDAGFFYDHHFNSIVLALANPWRIKALTTDIYPYCKTLRQDSYRHNIAARDVMFKTAVPRDILIAEELKTRGLDHEYRRTLMKAVCREYMAVCTEDGQNNSQYPMFLPFFLQHYDIISSMPDADVEPILEEARIEVFNEIQNVYNEHKLEYYLLNDNISFREWIGKIKGLEDITPLPPENDTSMPSPAPEPIVIPSTVQDPRIVVYCGTYDVYLNMVASAKSVLCNIPVNKIYFLTEDDTFPYDIPDIIETINVKNQPYFPHDGPNYDNSWTWMCMMRAAYPEIFPQYDKILSLDIDIVFNDNVSDLWDYNLDDYYLAGVPERQRQKSSADPLYINFGVVMMNLAKLRQDNCQQRIIDILNTRKVDCPEQGAFNEVCAGHILELPADYNYTTYSHITGDAQRQRILHYAGQRFWRHYSSVKQYADLTWQEVMERQAKLHE